MIYDVIIQAHVVVTADDPAEAMRIAENAVWNEPQNCPIEVDDVAEVPNVGALPPGWDGGCIPFGKDERRIREILAKEKP